MQLRKESLKKIQAWTGFEPMTSTGVVLYQLSYEANWELVIEWIRNISVEKLDESEYMKVQIYEFSYIHLQN